MYAYRNNMNFYPAKKVAPHVWVGSCMDAADPEFMRRNDIRLIVNCTKDVPMYFEKRPWQIKSYRVPVDDSASDACTMARYLPVAALLINDVTRYGHNVLVHCYAGMNRSATITAGYLMFANKIDAAQAVAEIKRRKPECFQPNNFAPALATWEGKLRARRARRGRAKNADPAPANSWT